MLSLSQRQPPNLPRKKAGRLGNNKEPILYTLNPRVLWTDEQGQFTLYNPTNRAGFVARGLTAEAAATVLAALRAGPQSAEQIATLLKHLIPGEDAQDLLTALRARGVVLSSKAPAADPRSHVVGIHAPVGLFDAITAVLRPHGISPVAMDLASSPPVGLDLAVVVDTGGDPGALLKANLDFTARGTQSVMVEIGHDWIKLGPLTLPGEAGCYECDWIRTTSAGAPSEAPEWPKLPVGSDAPNQAADSVATGLISAVVLSAVGISAPATIGVVTEFDLQRWRIEARVLIEVPSCPACSSAPVPAWARNQ